MIAFALPWPDKKLSPNARVHHMVKAKHTKGVRQMAHAITLQATAGKRFTGPLILDMTFHPPSRRRYDLDNRIASAKGAIDGISDAIGVDDSQFELRCRMGEPTNGGRVNVRISEVGA